MPRTKPFIAIAAWKRRTQRPEQWVVGSQRVIDYTDDEDGVLAGVQNVLEIDNIPHDPAAELIDVFLIGANREGRHILPAFVYLPYSVTLDGTIDSVTTSVTVTAIGKANDWPNKAFVEVDDGTNREYMQITAGGGTTSWTVRRGEHASSKAGFASGSTVRRVVFNVPHKEVQLAGDATKLDPPSIAVEGILNGFHFTITPPTDTGRRLKAYKIYRDVTPTATTLWKTVLAEPNETLDVEFFLGFGEDKTATWYFRMKSVTRFGLVSDSFSNEVSDMVLTQPDDETTAVTPSAPTVTVAANGGSVTGGYHFTVGVTFTDDTGAGGVNKTQVQIAEPSATHDTGTGFSATVVDEDFSRPPFSADLRVPKSSAQVGGAYQFSARTFNDVANLWSPWSTPVTAFTTIDQPDSDAPGAALSFQIIDAAGADGYLGNTVQLSFGGSESDNNSIWGWETQASTSLWGATVADTLGMTVDNTGTGDITHGGTTVTNLSLGAADHSNKIIYVYSSIDTATGKVTGDQAAVILSNTADTVTLKSGYAWAKTAVGISYAIGSWNNYSLKVETLSRLAGGFLAAPGDGSVQSQIFPFSVAAYWRMRYMNRFGRGQWIYYDGSTGTTTRTSATQFTPKKMEPAAAVEELQALTSNFAAVPDGTSPNRKFSWVAFTIYFSDGSTQSIDAGDSGLLTANASYWLYATVGSSTLSITSSVASASGVDKMIIAVVRTASTAAEYVSVIPRWGDGNAILGVGVLNVGQLSAITADVGELTAGTVTGLLIRTSASDPRVEMDSTNGLRTFNSAGSVMLQAPVSGGDAGHLKITGHLTTPGRLVFGSTAELGDYLTKGFHVYPQSTGKLLKLGGSETEYWSNVYINSKRTSGGTPSIELYVEDASTNSTFTLNSTLAKMEGRIEAETSATEAAAAITVDQNDADQPFIDFEGTSSGDASNNISTLTAGNSVQRFARFSLNGVDYWVPFYDAPTS